MTDDNLTEGEQAIMAIVNERTEPEPDGKQDIKSNLWTSRRRLRQDGHKTDSPLSKSEVGDVIDGLIDSGNLFDWHGLLAPATEDHLRAIAGNENGAEITRGLLVQKVSDRLEEV